jgi:hypothetical protein
MDKHKVLQAQLPVLLGGEKMQSIRFFEQLTIPSRLSIKIVRHPSSSDPLFKANQIHSQMFFQTHQAYGPTQAFKRLA